MTTDQGMTNADAEERPEDGQSTEPETPTRKARVARSAKDAVGFARTSVGTIVGRVPGTARATRAGVRRTTTALQRLPDSKLRWLTATSVGLAAGFKLAGAPRLVTAAGAAPALLMGAAIALRPTASDVRNEDDAGRAAEEMAGMTDEHAKGTVTWATGAVEEGLGTLTGDTRRRVRGKAKQVKGDAQEALGDVQDAVREPKHQEREGA